MIKCAAAVATILVLFFVVVRVKRSRTGCGIWGNRGKELSGEGLTSQDKSDIFDMFCEIPTMGLCVKDVDHSSRYLIWNHGLEVKTGVQKQDIVGKKDADVTPCPGLLPFAYRMDEEALAKGYVECDTLCKHPVNDGLFIRIEKYFLKTKRGRSFIIGTYINLTNEWRLRTQKNEIIESQQKLIEEYQLVSDCVDFITHEYNFHKQVQYILKRFGEHDHSVRCYLSQYVPDSSGCLDIIEEWRDESSRPLPSVFHHFNDSQLPWLWKILSDADKAVVMELKNVPESSIVKKWSEQEELVFSVFVPLLIDGKKIGFVAASFDNPDVLEHQSQFAIHRIIPLIELAYASKAAHPGENDTVTEEGEKKC